MFFSCASFVQASVIINEIQLNPTEERFIELYNSGGSAVDLTDWYIQRKTATGSDFGSLISKTNFAGKSIGAGGYFLISKGDLNNSNIVFDSLTLTESNTIQIKNGAGDVVDKVGWGDATDCGGTCAPNPTDGKSIGRTSSGTWIIGNHTPAYVNNTQENNSDTLNNNLNTNSPSVSSTNSHKDVPEILKISTKIISPKTVIAGIDFSIDSLTDTNRGETYAVGKWVWNFGDGKRNEVGKATPFEYVYDYPGEYIVTLSYFSSFFSKTPDATDKIIIKVVPAEVFISGVATLDDPFIEIENKSGYEVILSNWLITAGNHYFTIPEGTILLPNKKIKFSPRITGFTGEDMSLVVISDPNKEITATYPTVVKKLAVKNLQSDNIVNSNQNIISKLKEEPQIEDSQIINLNDLGASAGSSGFNNSNQILPLAGLFVIILIGATSFLLIKKKKDIPDYIDKEISAKDMKIIE
jgi:LPXTG-motif cell wall-anchored protein